MVLWLHPHVVVKTEAQGEVGEATGINEAQAGSAVENEARNEAERQWSGKWRCWRYLGCLGSVS